MNNREKLAAAKQMFAAWDARDWDRIIDCFAPEGSMHSMMKEPVTGRDALEKLFDGFKDSIEALTLDIEHIGIIDDAVIAVRTDRMTVNGKRGALPAVGVIYYDENGKIRLWREYFDRATMLNEMRTNSDWA